jgi:phosphate-selective porin OprO/OprP
MERSSLNQYDPAQDWGLAAFWSGEDGRATAALGAFRTNTASDGTSTGNGNNWAITGRATGLPVYEDSGTFRLVHLGAAVSFRQPPNDVVTFNNKPQSNLLSLDDNAGSPILPTIKVPAKSQQIYNLQSAAVYDSFSVQAEWFGTTVQQPGAGLVFFHGFYVYGSLFLTGEHRGYDRKGGDFDRVSVLRPLVKTPEAGASGYGAVELTARFAVNNQTSSNLPPQAVGTFGMPDGIVLYDFTWGLNWYLNDYTRVMANYTISIPESRGSPALPVHVFGLRTAIYW